ncbi:hypothetical protein KNP414_05097 [Paenibacillus mucilaginosus KNP414]|uniref:Uncharacterized protein n=1 Tax=Paenibacillus mucilaginosus (strain KNP414) TaxID=1036673 RepID=F8F6V5_PAEMK|nr:hypothetical protein KNP414_05097 [Paenibacillus mucilaginosus KNP414]
MHDVRPWRTEGETCSREDSYAFDKAIIGGWKEGRSVWKNSKAKR